MRLESDRGAGRREALEVDRRQVVRLSGVIDPNCVNVS